MKRFAVYYLLDPRNGFKNLNAGDRAYVGISRWPHLRFEDHLRESIKCPERNTPKLRWIDSLLRRRLEPVLSIKCWLDSASEAKRIEVALIKLLKTRGVHLLNSTAGGDGLIDPSLEVIDKLRKVPRTPEWCLKLRLAKLGKPGNRQGPAPWVSARSPEEKRAIALKSANTRKQRYEGRYFKDPNHVSPNKGKPSPLYGVPSKLKGRSWSAKRRATEEKKKNITCGA